MNTPKLIIFDMDGLIFDSERTYMVEIRKALRDLGYELTEEDYKKTVGIRFPEAQEIMKTCYGQDVPYMDAIAVARPRMLARAAEGNLTVKPGIRELLAAIRAAGIPCMIASSSKEETVHVYVEGAGLSDYFTYVFGGDQVVKGKPDPEVFLKCCALAGVRPENALVLEDSVNGIKAGLAAGIPVICIPDMIEPPAELVPQLYALCRDGFEVQELMKCCL